MKFLKSSWVIVLVLLTVMTSCKKEELTTVDTQGIYLNELKLESIVPSRSANQEVVDLRTNHGIYFNGTFSSLGKEEEHRLLALPATDFVDEFNKLVSDRNYNEIIHGYSGLIIIYGRNGKEPTGGVYEDGVKKTDIVRSETPHVVSNSRTELDLCDYIIIEESHYIDWYQNGEYLDTEYNGSHFEYYWACADGIPGPGANNLGGPNYNVNGFQPKLIDERAAILPYSCRSFDFQDAGLFQVARLSGVTINMYNQVNGSYANCDFDIEVSASLFAEENLGGDLLITSGMAANAAADALNEALWITTAYYGSQHNYSNGKCNQYGETLMQIFNILLEVHLMEEVSEVYHLAPFEFELELGAEGQVGYSQLTGITPTTKVPDFSLLGFGKDDCR